MPQTKNPPLQAGFSKRTEIGLLHEPRSAGPRRLVLLHDAETARHFGIGFDEPAHVAAEAVLVELVLRLDVPEPAGIGGNLVGDDYAHHLAFPQPSAFHLEVDEPDADAEEKPREEVVDADRERHDVVDLLRARPAVGR